MDRGRTVMTRLNNNNEETIPIAAPLTGMRNGRSALQGGGTISVANEPLNYDLKTILITGTSVADGAMSPHRNLPAIPAHGMCRTNVSVVTNVHLLSDVEVFTNLRSASAGSRTLPAAIRELRLPRQVGQRGVPGSVP